MPMLVLYLINKDYVHGLGIWTVDTVEAWHSMRMATVSADSSQPSHINIEARAHVCRQMQNPHDQGRRHRTLSDADGACD